MISRISKGRDEHLDGWVVNVKLYDSDSDETKRAKIAQMMLDVMDAVEQTGIDEALGRAHNAFIKTRQPEPQPEPMPGTFGEYDVNGQWLGDPKGPW
jgi:hypothetical protein